jgi:hypothetical protein
MARKRKRKKRNATVEEVVGGLAEAVVPQRAQAEPAITSRAGPPRQVPVLTIDTIRHLKGLFRQLDDEWAKLLMIHWLDTSDPLSGFTVTIMVPGEPTIGIFQNAREAADEDLLAELFEDAERVYNFHQEHPNSGGTTTREEAVVQTRAELEAQANTSMVQRRMNETVLYDDMGTRDIFVPVGCPSPIIVNSMSCHVVPGQMQAVKVVFIPVIEEWARAQAELAAVQGQIAHVGNSGDKAYITAHNGPGHDPFAGL